MKNTTEKTKKITKKEMLTQIKMFLAQSGEGEFVDFIQHEIDLLDKRGQNKSKKVNVETIELRNEIRLNTKLGEKFHLNDLIFTDGKLKGMSSQKLTSVIAPMVESGEFTKEKEKGKNVYTRVVDGELEEVPNKQ